MTHTLQKNGTRMQLCINKRTKEISISNITNDEYVEIMLDKNELSDLIGVLLHLQSKLK